MSSPFFPDPLQDFEPRKPDFEPEIDPDYDEGICPVCKNRLDEHSTKQIIECVLIEVKGSRT